MKNNKWNCGDEFVIEQCVADIKKVIRYMCQYSFAGINGKTNELYVS
jgi:hypothetical protein